MDPWRNPNYVPFGVPVSYGDPLPPEEPDPLAMAMQSGDVAGFSAQPNYGLPAPRPSMARMVADTMTAGTWPYMAAGIQKLTGHGGGESFEDLRRREQLEVQRAREQYQNWAPIADYVAPFGAGLAVSRGAKTLGGAAMRAGATAGGYGAVHGYASPIEPDSTDVAARLPQAMTEGMLYGLGGYGARYGMGKGAEAFTDYFATRAANRQARELAERQAAEAQRLRRQEAGRKAAETRRLKASVQADYEAEQAAEAAKAQAKAARAEKREMKVLADEYSGYRKPPEKPWQDWSRWQAMYRQDRTGFIMERVKAGRSLESIAKQVNLSPAQLARYVSGAKDIKWTRQHEPFLTEVSRVLNSEKAYRALPKPTAK